MKSFHEDEIKKVQPTKEITSQKTMFVKQVQHENIKELEGIL